MVSGPAESGGGLSISRRTRHLRSLAPRCFRLPVLLAKTPNRREENPEVAQPGATGGNEKGRPDTNRLGEKAGAERADRYGAGTEHVRCGVDTAEQAVWRHSLARRHDTNVGSRSEHVAQLSGEEERDGQRLTCSLPSRRRRFYLADGLSSDSSAGRCLSPLCLTPQGHINRLVRLVFP